MKSLTRVTLLILLSLFASTAAFGQILVGQLYLDNTSSSSDEFDLLNATGVGAPSNGTTTALTFSGVIVHQRRRGPEYCRDLYRWKFHGNPGRSRSGFDYLLHADRQHKSHSGAGRHDAGDNHWHFHGVVLWVCSQHRRDLRD